ncbi:hypothetical protein PIB30_061133 [Stylosanthes scabra]|uniref:PB1 domain-containing protein n=1 Tax=Stylosanthes scabra TaxID=79078 RepID=A0ABU6RLB0_9FABA|nr:hypothetical protein [Stylosanthes scabra]
MSEPPLLSIHYDGEITANHNGSVVFCSNQPLFIRMPQDVRSLVALKNFVAHTIGVHDTKRATKIYYRYPMEVDGNFQFKRYRLRDDDDIKLILAGPASRNIRRMMVNLNNSPGGSNEGFNYGVDSELLQGMLLEEFESHEGSLAGDPMTEPFHLDPDQDDGRDEDEEELNSLRISQVSLAQPAISQLYEYPDHFSTLNLDAMNSDVCLGQGALMMIRRLSLSALNLERVVNGTFVFYVAVSKKNGR